MYDVDDVDRLIAELGAMRTMLEAAAIDADCSQHEHPDDDGD